MNIVQDNQETIDIMIVDDSPIMHNLLEKILKEEKNVKVVCNAFNGQGAIDLLKKHIKQVKIILLDIDMPIMDGLQSIPYLLSINPQIRIIIVSSLSKPGAKQTVRALSLGASDYIEKPLNIEAVAEFSKNLVNKIQLLSKIYYVSERDDSNKQDNIILRKAPKFFRPNIIAIASSTGGPRALMEVLSLLPKNFLLNKSVFITQHIKKDFLALLIENIVNISLVNCKAAQDNEMVENGVVYVAPSDVHMEVEKRGGRLFIKLVDSPPENFCRPSADPMLRSLAKISSNILTIVLTGIGSDGLIGSKAVVENGGVVIAQDRETSVVWGMPGSVVNEGICSAVLPLNEIATYIQKEFS
jgi:two-component system, chemotaxis family, protein-glutamate methylesterase/glutaminase